MQMFEYAPAKVNLALQLIARRDDGYHELDSIVTFLDFGDVLTVAPREDTEFTLSIEGAFSGGLTTPDNLVLRAAKLLQAEAGGEYGADLKLEKNIPIGAGLGGGSSDAAAVLRLLNRVWQLEYSLEKLADLGARLGADIPACVYGAPLRMRGIGEQIMPLPKKNERFPVLLLHPGTVLMTPEVYRAVQPPYSGVLGDTGKDWLETAISAKNDLELAAFTLLPELREMLATIAAQEGCKLARMSGSGSACFALFDHEANTKKAAQSLRAAFPDVWLRACTLKV